MKDKLIVIFPYILVGIIILYLFVKYDAINSGEETSEEEKVPGIEILLSNFFSFDAPEKINFVADEKIKFEGKSSAKIATDNMYGPTFVCDLTGILKKTKKVLVSFMSYSAAPVKESSVVISFSNDKGNVIYKNAALSEQFKINEWNKSFAQFEIDDALLAPENKIEFKAYVLNSKNEELYIDNFKVELLGLK
jgi:hypothetical protein